MEWKLRPARDLGLPAAARLRSLNREPGLIGVAVNALWRQLVRFYLRLFHRLSVTGMEHLPTAPPFVLIANHASHLDALTLASVLRGPSARNARALAAGETFFGSAGVAMIAAYAINAFPVWRGRTRQGDLATLRARLTEDALVYILFPEGTRTRDGTMARFQPGIGALVAGTEVPIVPCVIEGAFAAWPPQRRWPRPGRLRLAIGPALRFADVVNERAGWIAVASSCESAVRALGDDLRRGVWGGDRRPPPPL
ncbi:lysophospholipid acyltransferase family protein [Elioraea sp.]|uniref:lysophospholipid acyltransferase family protein n=1 Tax=Elioraea sp. TaxID=2185103 RepID=UPI003F6EC69C